MIFTFYLSPTLSFQIFLVRGEKCMKSQKPWPPSLLPYLLFYSGLKFFVSVCGTRLCLTLTVLPPVLATS